MKKFSNTLNYLAAIIIFVSVILVIILAFKFLSTNTFPQSPQTLVVKFKIDSTQNKHYNDLELQKLDTISKYISKKTEEIQFKQDVIIQNQSNDTFFNKLFTVVIAFIIAVAGFFGFKSINEIKDQSIEEAVKAAKEEAIKAAKEEAVKAAKEEAAIEFTKVFTTEYKKQIFEQATKAAVSVIRGELNEIRNDISTIQNDILNIQSRLGGDSLQPEADIQPVDDDPIIDPFETN